MNEGESLEKSSNQDSINRLKMMLGQDTSPKKTSMEYEKSPTKPRTDRAKSPNHRSDRFTVDDEAELSNKINLDVECVDNASNSFDLKDISSSTQSSSPSPSDSTPVDIFDFSSFPTEPVPLILPEVDGDGREELVVQEKALQLLRRIAIPVVVLAVSGLYRSGKSSLLNWLCNPEINSDLFQTSTLSSESLESNKKVTNSGFAVGATVMRCTRGIWLWGRPRVVTLQDGTQGALVVMDTEGLGGMDAGAAYDARVFSLSALLCSTMLYNSLGTIDEKAISSLSFVADLARNIRLTSSDEKETDTVGRDDGGNGKESLSDLGHLFPSFVWVLRDFALDLVDDDGETMNAEEYLDQCLRPQQGYDAGVAERNKIRRALTTFFQNRTCCTLVRPLHNEEQLQQIDIVKWEEFRPEFCKDFRLLQSTLLQILKPKFTVPPRNSGGRPRPMNGQMYATLIGEYVKAVNSEGAPVVATAWEQVTANECLDAASKALANHKQLLNSFTLPSDATIAAEAHATALYSAMKSYDERAEGKNAASERAELQSHITLAYQEWCAMNEASSTNHCRNLINKLYQSSPLYLFESEEGRGGGIVENSSENEEIIISSLPHTDMIEAVENCWRDIIKQYWLQAKGPKGEFELLECVKAKWVSLANRVLVVVEGQTTKEADSAESSLMEARRLASQMKSENELCQTEITTSTELVAKYKLDLDKTKESLQSAIENEKRAKDALKGEVKKRRELEMAVDEASEENSRLQRELEELKASNAITEAEKQHLTDRLEAVPPFEEKGPTCCTLQ